MLHAHLQRLESSLPGPEDVGNRRQAERLRFPADAILAWNHDLTQLVRVRVGNISNDGMSVHSRLPMVAGLTGIMINLLPEGVAINRPFRIAWAKRTEDGIEHEAGLEFM